jgi:beta-galactosidase
MVTFKVTGPARIDGVGNGDPSCHEPDKASQRSAFNGYCLVIVQATDRAGKITLTAESPGLKPATVNIESAKNGVSLD